MTTLENSSEKSNKRISIFLPRLPELSSDHIDLDDKLNHERSNLVRALRAGKLYVANTKGKSPWLKDIHEHFNEPDAYILSPLTHYSRAEKAQRWFEFFSLVTGIHIGSDG